MNNNYKKAQKMIDCYNQQNKNTTFTCFGPTGPTGPTGPAINLSIGTVETGAPGSTATATITGTSPNYVLNLTIPAGPTGPAGA